MKKLLVLLALTALVFALLAACDSKDTAPLTETTTAVAEVQATVEDTQAPEVQTTLKTEEPKTEEKTQNKEKLVKDTNPEVPLSDPTKAVTADVKVSKEDAKKAVLAHAGLNESDVKFYKAELDRERAGLVYEIEFDAGKYEYEYEVDAETGKVLKAEKEFRD